MKEIRKDKKTKVTDNAIVKALLSESDPKQSGDFLIACSDKANEVEPRPNEDDMLVGRWNNLLMLTCHPYGILLTDNIFSTNISSLRDFLSATTEINAGIACLDRTDEVEPRPNEAHFQFSIRSSGGSRKSVI
jgi:hypothetical protein